MIPVQNVYYMLAYAFQVLNEDGYRNVATEQFNNVAELCAAILTKGVSLQLKRGLGRDYISETETLSGLRGKIDITESIKTQTMLRRQMVCTYDEFSVNTYMNRIIKTTMLKLLHADIDKARKKKLESCWCSLMRFRSLMFIPSIGASSIQEITRPIACSFRYATWC